VRQLANRGITFPVIFIGANDNERVEKRALEIGCVAFFRKPFSTYLLVEALYDLADSYSARRTVM
jgi:FixJ family two-component response regulator